MQLLQTQLVGGGGHPRPFPFPNSLVFWAVWQLEGVWKLEVETMDHVRSDV